jgi:glycosyltransferase involved in cell wall biosynthesis
MSKVLYITYWGALEQLGQSLVIPAVKKLARMGVDLTLVTFEKPTDLAKTEEMMRVRRILEDDGIEWIPLKYHKTPKIPATLFDISNAVVRSLLKRLTNRYDILHARTYTSGLIGLLLAPLIGAKFVYHNEGFYPDEQVDAGVWTENSRPHLIAKQLENKMYARADGIIALSHRAKAIIEQIPAVARQQTPVISVPSCVDLERFHQPETRPVFSDDEIKLVYVGSVGGRYILDKIGAFVTAARKTGKNVTLQIFSKSDPELITKMLDSGDLAREAWSLEAVPYLEIPNLLTKYQAGIHFLKKGISEHSGSPTKIGEYWAVGLPIIITPNISDTDEIINHDRVGVIVKEHSVEAYLQALNDLLNLLPEPDLSQRCRKAAEEHYALVSACERQFALYQQLVKIKQ